MRSHKILGTILIFFNILTAGCSKQYDPADPDLFYNIVYIALYSRSSSGQWFPVQGEYKVKFTQETEGETTNGTYIMSYSSYLEPQFCSYNINCVCSGGISGSFIDVTEEEPIEDTTKNPYNVFDPEDSTSTEFDVADTIDPTTGLPIVELIQQFKFDIIVENSVLSLGCKPESNKSLLLLRFKDGSVVMRNDYRDLYFAPLVLTE